MSSSPDPTALAAPLLSWYDRNGRALPWRNCGDPWLVLVSELMLQQTRVDTVLKRWDAFVERFPDADSLAAASDEEVRAAWSGLGFYRRARNLHESAKRIVAEHGGVIPEAPEALSALPGVGRYTLGAILSHAFDRPFPILDGNVARVLSRIFRIDGDPKSGPVSKRLWVLAEAVLPERRPGDFNQALMDLGATVCTPRNPSCLLCPLRPQCGAFESGDVDRFPATSKKTAVRHIRRVAMLLQRDDGALLLVQRPPDGLLAELWELPAADLPEGAEPLPVALALAHRCRAADAGPPEPRGVAEHRFSHRHWSVQVWTARPTEHSRGPDDAPWRWVLPHELPDLGVPTVTRKMLRAGGLEELGRR